jgi:GH25 family lysozyme M1 (1,4-beta-N-acetylmuramidase)
MCFPLSEFCFLSGSSRLKKSLIGGVSFKMAKSLIVDLSHHQPSSKINWEKASKEVALVIIRVQYGSLTIDREYKQHIANCKKHNIPFAHYAYGMFTSVEDAKVEARDFLKRIDKDAQFLVLDTEDDTINSCGTKNVAAASQAFIDICRKAGFKTGFYVSHHLHNSYGLNTVKADFKWVPRYGKNDSRASKKPDFPCELWQFTDKGKVDWYGGYLDLNQLNGDKPLEWFFRKEKAKEGLNAQSRKRTKNPDGTYTVKSGDTLFAISKDFNVTVDHLVNWNNIIDKNFIKIGQILKVKESI